MRFKTAAIALASLVMIAACGGGNSPAASGGGGQAKGDPYVVGAVSDQSAALAYVGGGLVNGATAYFNYLNSHGGINGHPVRYIPLDDKSDTSTAIANLKLLTDSYNAVAITAMDSSVTVNALLPDIDKAAIPTMIQGVTTQSLQDPNAFNTAAYIAGEAQPQVDMAANILGSKASGNVRAAIFSQVSSVLAVWRTNEQNAIKSKGWTISSDQTVTLASTDVTAQVQAIVNSNPDVVLQTMSGPKIVLSVQGYRKLGWQGPVVSHTSSADVPSLKSLADPNFYVLREYAFPEDSGQAIKNMDSQISAAGFNPDTAFVINGYVQAYLLTAGLQKCGWPCSRSKLLQTMSNLKVDTKGLTFAPVNFNNSNHSAITALKAYKWDTTADKPVALPNSVPYSAG